MVPFRLSYEPTIHAFDLCSEEFHGLALPENHLLYHNTSLLEWNESVALLYRRIGAIVDQLEIWVLSDCGPSDHGSRWGWSDKLRVDVTGGIPKPPFAFLGSDEIVMRMGAGNTRIVSYNLMTKKIRSVCDGDVSRLRAIGFVQSLIGFS